MSDIACHLLRKNHRSYIPRRLLFLDTETKAKVDGEYEKQRMKIGWTCYINFDKNYKDHKEKWIFHTSTYGLCKYIESLALDKSVLYVFGHNIFFDLQASDFFHYFTLWNWKLDFVYDKGLTYILVIHKGKKRIKILSTTNFYDTSVEKLGELLNIPKLKIDFDNTSDEYLKEYCKRDVEIIKVAMLKYFEFLRSNDLGGFALTRASQSFNAYRHRFMKHKIYVHYDDEIIDMERKAYFGGRTECFRFGIQDDDDYVIVDVNSMYPFVMKNYPVPYKAVDVLENVSIEHAKAILNKYLVVAEVDIDTPEPAYAYRQGEKTIFPVGRIHTFVCTEGLKYAIENGHLKHIYRLVAYNGDYLFTDYVNFFYELKTKYKKESNKIWLRIVKIFLNSLYGKFGQKATIEDTVELENSNEYSRVETVDLVTGETYIEYTLLNKKVTVVGEVSSKKAFVSIPAHITEYARFYLWKFIKLVGIENVYYTDTDSLIIKRKYLYKIEKYIDNYELGKLSIDKEFNHLEIYGAKHYYTEYFEKIKGVPKSAEKLGDFVYQYKQFLRQSTHLRKQITRYFLIKNIVKVVRPYYDKGEVLRSGNVKPLNVTDF